MKGILFNKYLNKSVLTKIDILVQYVYCLYGAYTYTFTFE